ncbi:MAG: hypothetical protein ABI091_10215 [Ferruginibacter sp.]
MMRHLLYIASIFLVVLSSCSKDKFTSAPQIKFKSIAPNYFYDGTFSTDFPALPILHFQLTDAEGDIGINDTSHSSYVYIRNITTNPNELDSVKFPDLSKINHKNLNADIAISLFDQQDLLLVPDPGPGNRPHTDTLYYEVYVKDFANNKSNVVKMGPLYYIFK